MYVCDFAYIVVVVLPVEIVRKDVYTNTVTYGWCINIVVVLPQKGSIMPYIVNVGDDVCVYAHIPCKHINNM
jgi:hypothetical protein